MDILYLVDRLDNLIASSHRMPLVNQILIKEGDILNIVDQMRTSIPDEIKQARRIIQEKERILAQAQADATTLLTRAREETERAMNREGLLRAAEARSQELVRQAEERAHSVTEQAEEHGEQLKNEADNYVAETLRNLKDHLASIEMDISRTILSIDKGLESLEIPEEEGEEELEMYYEESEGSTELEDLPVRSVPRRASLANDTQGGPVY
ncbi:MAG: ATP synthase F0 subunit B [Chloroflexi bacterium]|nr:MAG: ATP synthase F0 subunit B [Chloroflexota bacterium]